MTLAGLEAFKARSAKKAGIYSYEQRPADLTEPYAGMLARNRLANEFFKSQAPWYRRTATWWVVSAKKEETRLKRVQKLIEHSKRRELLPQLDRSRLK